MTSQEGKKKVDYGASSSVIGRRRSVLAARCFEEASGGAEQHRITRQNTQCSNRKKNEDEITLEIVA